MILIERTALPAVRQIISLLGSAHMDAFGSFSRAETAFLHVSMLMKGKLFQSMRAKGLLCEGLKVSFSLLDPVKLLGNNYIQDYTGSEAQSPGLQQLASCHPRPIHTTWLARERGIM